MANQIIIITLQILTVIIGLYLALVKSYFQEKGKNIATKEDINFITEKVEAVKTEFQILSHSRTTLNSEKRNSYLSFYDKYFLWLNTLLDTSHGNIDYYKSEEIDRYSTMLNGLYLDICIAETRMQLWNDNEELISLIQTLKIETLEKFHHLCLHHLCELKIINHKLEDQLSTLPKYTDEYKSILNDHSTMQEDYAKTLISNYKVLVNTTHEFIIKSRDYLITIN
ncbi:hypothetical protein [Aquirufa nivalisilvae]